jgi:hypothetical protein
MMTWMQNRVRASFCVYVLLVNTAGVSTANFVSDSAVSH